MKKYTHNETFFNVIDSEVKAYWLGFLAADGYVSDRAVKLALAQKDRDHIERFRSAIEATHPVKIETKKGQLGWGASTCVVLYVHSFPLVSSLRKLGLRRDKSFSLPWPTLPAPLYRHYLRGYIDGNGGFYAQQVKDRGVVKKRVTFCLTSNEAFLRSVQEFLFAHYRFPITKFSYRHKTKTSASLFYCGRNQIQALYALLYEGATVWLPRKKEAAEVGLSFTPVEKRRPHNRYNSGAAMIIQQAPLAAAG